MYDEKIIRGGKVTCITCSMLKSYYYQKVCLRCGKKIDEVNDAKRLIKEAVSKYNEMEKRCNKLWSDPETLPE